MSLSFRAGSEHTIDNRRFDLELQVEMMGEGNSKQMIAVLFSVDRNTTGEVEKEYVVEAIDKFFESVKWD